MSDGDVYRYEVDEEIFSVYDQRTWKRVRSRTYNYDFNKETGFFARWGETPAHDPSYSPLGPEILDIEISTDGCPNACDFCYKDNRAGAPTNMSLSTFESIIRKFPKSLTQVAFGITGVTANPDFLAMMQLCRRIGIIPNFTLSGTDLEEGFARQCAEVVGAVAVSAHPANKDTCYDTVKIFTDLGVGQTNIHVLLSQETLPSAYEVLHDRLNDARLARMNAVVFLGVKPKGRAEGKYTPLSINAFAELTQFCYRSGIPFGFDSCSAPKFEATVRDGRWDDHRKARMLQLSESCESLLFSGYINVAGDSWMCSFAEGEQGQRLPSILSCEDFLRDFWHASPVRALRRRLLANAHEGCRPCILFPVINP